jgi:ribulose-phosphate 3-epimerase
MPKLERLRALTAGRGIHLQVDGGIDPTTAPVAIAAGADALVAGTSVFKKPDYAAAIAALRPAVRA